MALTGWWTEQHLHGEVVIHRPLDVVFDTVADERNEPSYNPRVRDVQQLTPGPVGQGTRFRATAQDRGDPVPMEIEYTAFERPTRLASRTVMAPMDTHGQLTFRTVPGGTRMQWSWCLHPKGALRLLAPLIRAVGARQERSNWQGLKRFLEAGPVDGAGGPR